MSNLPGVRQVRVFSHREDRTAHMEICLRVDTWPAREAVIDAMGEIREMFFDDLSISYSFGDAGAGGMSPSEQAESLVYA